MKDAREARVYVELLGLVVRHLKGLTSAVEQLKFKLEEDARGNGPTTEIRQHPTARV